MSKIQVVVDTACDIPAALLEQYGIIQVPVWVHWQGREYRDKLDLELTDLFGVEAELPTTSQPSPGQFAEVFRNMAGKEVLSLHIAGSLSGTYASAVAGAELTGETTVHTFDTRSISMGAGLQALEAARAIEAGGDARAALTAAGAVRDNMEIILILDTLEWIKKGGRISRLQATLGSLLNIKPMLRVSQGAITAYDKARSRARSLQQLLEAVVAKSRHDLGQGFVAAVGHGGAREEQLWLSARLKERLPLAELLEFQVGIAIGAHGGPGVLGVCFYNR